MKTKKTERQNEWIAGCKGVPGARTLRATSRDTTMQRRSAAFSHIAADGSARMVDVSLKPEVKRTAIAGGTIRMAPATVRLLKKGLLKKGDALGCARTAGILAAKKTPELIPLCHPLLVTHAAVDFTVKRDRIEITASAACTGRTGIEMEALTAVAVAALTVYDMCKAVDKGMIIDSIRLIEKRKEMPA